MLKIQGTYGGLHPSSLSLEMFNSLLNLQKAYVATPGMYTSWCTKPGNASAS